MKSKEEIKLMGEKYAITHEDVSDRLGKYLVSACFQDGYIQCQCQEDMADKKYTEEDMIKFAFDTYCYISGIMKVPFNKVSENRTHAEDNFKVFINSLNKQD